MSAPYLVVTTDQAAGIALVKGRAARYAVRLVADIQQADMPPYSKAGRGFVVPQVFVGDLLALAQVRHEYVVIHERKAAA